mgnify:CR=1 FL=1
MADENVSVESVPEKIVVKEEFAPRIENDYLVVIKIPFKSLDDVGARIELEQIKTDPMKYFAKSETQIRLQKLQPGKPPIGMS